MTYSEAFKAATSFFSTFRDEFADHDNIDVWVATLIDWDNEHPEMGDVLITIPSNIDHPAVRDRNNHVELYYRDEQDRWTVKYSEGPDHDRPQHRHFNDLDEATSRVRDIVEGVTTAKPRADRYGSRERERRLRQDAHGPY